MNIEEEIIIHRLNKNLMTGDAAKQLMENKLYQEAWDIFDEEIFEAFKGTDCKDLQELQLCRLMLSVTKQMRNYFEDLVVTGEMAKLDLKAFADFEDQNRSETQH